MTVAELAQRSGQSVAQLVELAFGSPASSEAAPKRGPGRPPGGGKKRGRPPGSGRGPGRPPKEDAPAAAAPAAAKGKPGKAAEVDTRAAASRSKFDESVLAAVRGQKGRVKAVDLRKKVGGSSLQIRAALHRLIEDGKIKSQGKARGTTYSA